MHKITIETATNGFVVSWPREPSVYSVGYYPNLEIFTDLPSLLQFVAQRFAPPYWEGKVVMQEGDCAESTGLGAD